MPVVAHRRALQMVSSREMGVGGNTDTALASRGEDKEKFALGVSRINSSTTTSSTTTTNNNKNNKSTPKGWSFTNNNNNAAAASSSSSSLIEYFHIHIGDILVAPLHRRLDLYFREEVGRGEGPTQEVYSEFGRQISNNPKLWVNDGNTLVMPTTNKSVNDDDDDDGSSTNNTTSSSSCSFKVSGFIPAGGTEKEMYTLGVLCGRAVLDGFVVNVPYHELIFTFLSCNSSPQQQSVVRDAILAEVVDPAYFKNVKALHKMSNQELEATGLETEDGKTLNKKNIARYIDETLNERFEPIKLSIEAFGRGVQRVIDYNFLKACFENHELPFVLGGVSPRGDDANAQPLFTMAELDACIVPVHGYTHQCRQIQWLKETLVGFAPSLQADFVEFLTGSRGLPAGGVTNLSSNITVGKKQFDEGDTNAKQGTLPSCSTCFLYVKLPPYTSIETMKTRLLTAIQEGRRTFSHSSPPQERQKRRI